MLQRAIFLPGGTIQSPTLCVSNRLKGQRNGAETPVESKSLLGKNPLLRNNGALCQSILIKWHSETGICSPLNISTTQYKFFRMPDFMTHASQCPWLNAFTVLVPPCSLCRKENREEPVEKSGPKPKLSWMGHPHHTAVVTPAESPLCNT